MFGTIRIGVDSSCDVFSSAPSIVSQIRWCSEGTEKVPESLELKRTMGLVYALVAERLWEPLTSGVFVGTLASSFRLLYPGRFECHVHQKVNYVWLVLLGAWVTEGVGV